MLWAIGIRADGYREHLGTWLGASESLEVYSASGAMPSKRSVLRSRPPWKYLSSSRSNTDPAGDTHANKVAHDLTASFIV